MRKKGLFLVIVLIISAAFIQNQIQKNEKCKIYEKILSDDPKNPAINLGILENDKIFILSDRRTVRNFLYVWSIKGC